MDAITGFFAQLLASTGLDLGKEFTLLAVLVLAVLIVVVALALSRRSGRLEVHLGESHHSHAAVREPTLVPARGLVSNAVSDSDESKRTLGGADRPGSVPVGNPGGVAADVASSGKTLATSVPRTKPESMAVERSLQNDQVRFELMHATLSSLQREQLALRKLLENCNAGLRSIEQVAAAFPSLRAEHASIKKQLAELTARFDTVSEVLADLLQTEDRQSDR